MSEGGSDELPESPTWYPSFGSARYEIRLLPLHHLRDKYLAQIANLTKDIFGRLAPVWYEQVDEIYGWCVTEAIVEILRRPIYEHYDFDVAKTIYRMIRSELKAETELILVGTGFIERRERIHHLKIMALSDTAIVAAAII